MGFCLYNNVAVAARAAQATGSARRILLVDWDLHHGNGTQHAFWEDPTVLYFSTHQHPFYPGTGSIGEIGRRSRPRLHVERPLAGWLRRRRVPGRLRSNPAAGGRTLRSRSRPRFGGIRRRRGRSAGRHAPVLPRVRSNDRSPRPGRARTSSSSPWRAATTSRRSPPPPRPARESSSETRPKPAIRGPPSASSERVLEAAVRAARPFWPGVRSIDSSPVHRRSGIVRVP